MSILVDDKNFTLYKCDKCGIEFGSEDSNEWEIKFKLWRYTFFERNNEEGWFKKITFPQDLHGDYCNNCLDVLTPWVYRLSDICELNMYVNKFERIINDKRKQQRIKDDGAAKNNACKCSKRRYERRFGYRQGISSSQASEEHF
jgi:hypothetical protein